MSNNIISELKAELAEEKPRVLSGFMRLDDSICGFRPGSTYIVGGLKKSGKSTFLMNMVCEMLKNGEKVGFVNTELSKTQFFERMAAIENNLLLKEVEGHASLPVSFLETHKDYFLYCEKKDIKDSTGLSLGRTISVLKDWTAQGAGVLVVDNLTTFSTEATNTKRGWEVLASCLDKLIDFAKENKVILFLVIHTKDQTIFTETPSGIRSLVDRNEMEKIFEKSIVINRRPTSGDLYSGGAAKSQVSGGILLLWRPYQDFALTDYQRMTMLVLEDFRDGATTNEIRMNFDGARLRFTEELTAEEIFK